MVTTRDIWQRHGGQDERFISWGYEDTAWGVAHETLLGPLHRHRGFVYALTHVITERKEETQNIGIDLMQRYEDARHDIEAMRELVFTERGLIPPTSSQTS